MLRTYEFTVIFRSDLGDDNLHAALRDYEGIVANKDGGTILKKDEWGTKRFSYPIKKHFRGYYVCYVISTTPKVIKDIEQHIRYDNKVLRYIIVTTSAPETSPSDANQTPDAGKTDGDQVATSSPTTEGSAPETAATPASSPSSTSDTSDVDDASPNTPDADLSADGTAADKTATSEQEQD
ncbi:MAG: 30S ribosomal protein S6 [Pseudomonadota bacterium]|nr:30S ribosomal protein S6 [Pseudomonadota bacterium]